MPPDLQSLRQQLQEKFPEAHQSKPPPAPVRSSSQLPAFPSGALSELSPAGPASGLSLVLAELLQRDWAPSPSPNTAHHHEKRPRRQEQRREQQQEHDPFPTTAKQRKDERENGTPTPSEPLGLIDGRDSFDPASYGSASCSRLLWIRCHNAKESIRCTDLLLHDGNLPLLVLDLQLNPLEELRKIPTSSWYRLRNLTKQSGIALLIFTPKHLIPCAALQLTFDSTFTLTDLEQAREDLSPVRYQQEQAATGNS